MYTYIESRLTDTNPKLSLRFVLNRRQINQESIAFYTHVIDYA